MTNEERKLLKEKLRLYLKNLGGAYSTLVPPRFVGAEREKIQKAKEDFKKVINRFYTAHDIPIELSEQQINTLRKIAHRLASYN